MGFQRILQLYVQKFGESVRDITCPWIILKMDLEPLSGIYCQLRSFIPLRSFIDHLLEDIHQTLDIASYNRKPHSNPVQVVSTQTYTLSVLV